MPSSVPLQAFADESFLEAPDGGYYILAATAVAPETRAAAQAAMLALNGTRATSKLHWTDLDRRQRQHAAETVAKLAHTHIVIIGSPVPARRQERARAKCLERLVIEAHALGVGAVVIESRTQVLNARDLRTVVGARYQLPKGQEFTISHVAGVSEPLLWIPDIVAGAVRLHRQGDPRCHAVLADYLYEVEVDTGCGHA